MELVQFNALEFHPWGSHAANPDVADRVVFDLDPGPDVPFAEVKRAATDIRKLLAGLELESFLRVSGGKGLHVVVPLNPGCDWDLTKRFAHGFADALAQSEPHRFLSSASKRLRNKRIFVDYLRNGRGATAVASYSLRGRAGGSAARLECALEAQARQRVHPGRGASDAAPPAKGSVGRHRPHPAEPLPLGGRVIAHAWRYGSLIRTAAPAGTGRAAAAPTRDRDRERASATGTPSPG